MQHDLDHHPGRPQAVRTGLGVQQGAQVAFAAQFGPLTGAYPTVPSVAGRPNILPVDSEGGDRANAWHTDVTFVPTPSKASTLRGITIRPPGAPSGNAAT
jgi:alpha-ketoglutarate-dependent taurine dioxygenase